MDKLFDEFMTIYLKFLSKDLVASLDAHKGRNEKVIAEFLKVYYIVTNKTYSESIKLTALKKLNGLVDRYIQDGDVEAYTNLKEGLVKLLSHNSSSNRIERIAESLQINLERFIEANKYYKDKFPYELYFKQSMIEFNNALSHIFNIYISTEKMHSNLIKSNIHLHRGALDFYKTIIREKMKDISQDKKIELNQIRLSEYGTVGDEVKSSTNKISKIDVVDKYKSFANSLR